MAGKPRKHDKRNRSRRADYAKEKLMEKLALFEEFEQEFLPQLKDLLKNGADSAKMRGEMAPILTAKLLSMAITEKDAGKALAIIRDQLDRAEGKAKERSEVEHKFSNLKDEELDALLTARLNGNESQNDDEATSKEQH
jgi:hypothetical protein